MDEINKISLTPQTPQKSTGLIIKVIIGVVLLVIAGLAASLYARVWDPLWSPFRPEPEEIIAKMQSNMKELKALHTKGKIKVEGKEDTKEFKFSLIFEGDLDKIDPENLKGTQKVDITAIIPGQGQFSLGGEIKTIGKTSYLKLNIPLFFESLLEVYGIDMSQIKDQWIKIDKEELEKLGRIFEGTYLKEEEISQEKQKALTEKLKELFAERKTYDIRELPDQKIGKTTVYHYLLALDREEIKKIIPELYKIILESSDQSLPGESEFMTAFIIGGLTESINQFLDKIGEVTFDVWIGKKDFLLYKIKLEKEIDLSKFDEKIKGQITIKIDIDYSNFNQSVKIEAPENFKSLEEVIPWLKEGELLMPL